MLDPTRDGAGTKESALRIALTATFAWPEVHRGGERYLHELGRALAGRGHQVRVVASAPRASRDEVLGVPVRRLRRRPWLAPGAGARWAPEVSFGRQALPALFLTRMDVWHALTISDAASATVMSRVRPRVVSAYTDLGFPARASRSRRPDHRQHQAVVDHADVYVCLSEPAAESLRRDYGRDPTVVGAGVHLQDFQPARRDRRPTLLFASDADEPRKNAALFLHVVGRLLETVPDLQAWMLGPGDVATLLRGAPAEVTTAVTVARRVGHAELARRYARAWVTVLPSSAEAFGLVALESLASGTPAVVLQGGGAEGIVTPGTGVVASEDDGALVEACLRALDLAADPAVATSARDRASEFTWDRVAMTLEALYETAR